MLMHYLCPQRRPERSRERHLLEHPLHLLPEQEQLLRLPSLRVCQLQTPPLFTLMYLRTALKLVMNSLIQYSLSLTPSSTPRLWISLSNPPPPPSPALNPLSLITLPQIPNYLILPLIPALYLLDTPPEPSFTLRPLTLWVSASSPLPVL